MNNEIRKITDNLNNDDISKRLESLALLVKHVDNGKLTIPAKSSHVNNHIHTNYSFSPYSPAKAIWMAINAGLSTAGIMDHDSISGAKEFIEAGKIAGIATTIGVECRADFTATPLNGKRINNPDQNSIAYIALHGIPHTQIERVDQYFSKYRCYRNQRNRKMTGRINELTEKTGIRLDFDNDIVPLSRSHEGGSITERHLLYALSLKLIEKFGRGAGLIHILNSLLKLNISPRLSVLLSDPANPYYDYDLLGLLKGEMVPSFYINSADECPPIEDLLAFSREIGAITAYAYLGDVGDSVTGDKKAQKFEDAYLEQLFEVLKAYGFNAVTYMPSRNSAEQLQRLRGLCRRYNLFQISGEDINSPRQSFICEAMKDKAFNNLKEAAWALIGHESASTSDPDAGMFSPKTLALYPDLNKRTEVYRSIGLRYSQS